MIDFNSFLPSVELPVYNTCGSILRHGVIGYYDVSTVYAKIKLDSPFILEILFVTSYE